MGRRGIVASKDSCCYVFQIRRKAGSCVCMVSRDRRPPPYSLRFQGSVRSRPCPAYSGHRCRWLPDLWSGYRWLNSQGTLRVSFFLCVRTSPYAFPGTAHRTACVSLAVALVVRCSVLPSVARPLKTKCRGLATSPPVLAIPQSDFGFADDRLRTTHVG